MSKVVEVQYSLSQFNNLIKNSLEEKFTQSYWIVGEINNLSVSSARHCYLDLVEKDQNSGKILAQIRANIWANNYYKIKSFFEISTQRQFSSGIKVLILCSITFSVVYGISLNVTNISPEYTIGEIELEKKRTIAKLESEGLLELNRGLVPKTLLQNIAVITSKTAAGYGDFVNQVKNNIYGFGFNLYLFESGMQGENSISQIVDAFARLEKYSDKLDLVVLIRGGGSKTDLAIFDDYNVACAICKCSIPVITGIGHERDNSICDLVANIHCKTPTAVAQFIIDNSKMLWDKVENMKNLIFKAARDNFDRRLNKIDNFARGIRNISSGVVESKKQKINLMNLKNVTKFSKLIVNSNSNVDKISNQIEVLNPQTTLDKGYTITTKNGIWIKDSSLLNDGDLITTYFKDSKIDSIVKK